MRTSSAFVAITAGALALGAMFVVAHDAFGGIRANPGSVSFVGTGPVMGGSGHWTGTATSNDITVEGWGYWGEWDPKDGSYVGPPRLYLNSNGTYNMVDSGGNNVGTGTWSQP